MGVLSSGNLSVYFGTPDASSQKIAGVSRISAVFDVPLVSGKDAQIPRSDARELADGAGLKPARCSRRALRVVSSRLLAGVPGFARGFLQRVRPVRHPVGGDLPEEDASEVVLGGPVGLEGDGLGVVVAEDSGLVGGGDPGVLGLVVPGPGPALGEVLGDLGVVRAEATLLGEVFDRGIRFGDGEAAAVERDAQREAVRRHLAVVAWMSRRGGIGGRRSRPSRRCSRRS